MTTKNQNTQSKPATQALSDPAGSEPTAGYVYMVNCRFGRATVFVKRVDETWATCEVRSGTLRGMGRGAVWGEGDTKPLRISSSYWTLVQNVEVEHE